MINQNKRKVRNDEAGKAKRTYQGIVFDSELEMKYYRDALIPLQERGIIKGIELQPKYILQPKYKNKITGKSVQPIKYIGDFKIIYQDESFIVIDVKGMADAQAKIKRKLFEYVYPDIRLQWVGYRKHVWKDWDEIQQDKRLEKRLNKNMKEGMEA